MKAKTLRLRMTAGLLGCAVVMGLAATAAAQPVKTVRVWHTETNPASQKAVAEIVTRFETTRPGVKIEAEALSWDDLEGKIKAALAAGSPAGIVARPADDVRGAASTGTVAAARRCRPGHRRRQPLGADTSRSVAPTANSTALVHAAGTALLIYRKDLAKKLG